MRIEGLVDICFELRGIENTGPRFKVGYLKRLMISMVLVSAERRVCSEIEYGTLEFFLRFHRTFLLVSLSPCFGRDVC